MNGLRNDLRTKMLAICGICIVICFCAILSYAFFAFPLNNDAKITSNTGDIALTFTDGNATINEALEFGKSITKTFVIENTGSVDGSAKIKWVDLINTYLNGSLIYSLESSSSEAGEYTKIIENRNVPRSVTETEIDLADNLSIPAKGKVYYKLTITLVYSDTVDQTSDLKANLSSRFEIENASLIAEGLVPKIAKAIIDGTEIPKTAQIRENDADFTHISPTVMGYRDDVFSGSGSYRIDRTAQDKFYYAYADGYTFNQVNGTYTLTNPTVCELSDCYESLVGKYIVGKDGLLFGAYSASGVQTAGVGYLYKVTSATPDRIDYIPSVRYVMGYNYKNEGIFKIEDDDGYSYVFRGDVNNNYVKFAGFYWRIIRINGDGSLRLIYDGTKAHPNGEASTDRVALTNVTWNLNNYDDAKYIGYMYGGENGVASTSKEQAQSNETNSNVKIKLEGWYKTNIYDKGYDDYLSDKIFCSDRSTPGKELSKESWDTGLGYAQKETAYGAYSRLKTNKTPSLKCPNKNDSFTVTETAMGNGKLAYKVGLITADEVVAAGGRFYSTDGGSENKSYYLYKGMLYWTGSPYRSTARASIFFVINTGLLNNNYANSTSSVAPVINIAPEYARNMHGTGISTDPYLLTDEIKN